MELVKLLRKVVEADSEAWHRIQSRPDGEQAYHAAHLDDVRIGLRWGKSDPDYPRREAWCESLPDPKFNLSEGEILYNSAVVYAFDIASVDGGGCYVPLPDAIFGDDDQPAGWRVRRWSVIITGILQDLGGSTRRTVDYVKRLGFKVVDISPLERFDGE